MMVVIAIEPGGSPAFYYYRSCVNRDGQRVFELAGMQPVETLCRLSSPGPGGPFGPYHYHGAFFLVGQEERRVGRLTEHAVRVAPFGASRLVNYPGGAPLRSVVLRRRYPARNPPPFQASAWSVLHEVADSGEPVPLFAEGEADGHEGGGVGAWLRRVLLPVDQSRKPTPWPDMVDLA